MKILNNILDFVLPTICINCGKVDNYVCEVCEQLYLNKKDQKVCHVCKLPIQHKYISVHQQCKSSTYLDRVMICVDYNKLVERLLAEIKYNLYFRTSDYVTEKMFTTIEEISDDFDLFVPVPLHIRKEWKRGFNQAELFSKKLAQKTGLKSINMLKRNKNTQTQVGLTKYERQENLRGVFEIYSDCDLKNYNSICLVDDVMTTGTSLEECAKVLKDNGIQEITGLVFARG